jgi:predicted house-cleaning noncanonical NTP pyrophosphatase (MazG superfamily)
MQTMFIEETKKIIIIQEAIQMGDDKKELEDSILEEFEWALQDPNSEKIRQLGEVVSIITTKLMEAIDALQTTVNGIQTEVNSLDQKIASLSSRVASGGTVAPASAGASPAAGGGEPMAGFEAKPKVAPPPSAGGGMSMMGELKQLLAARRQKADSSG